MTTITRWTRIHFTRVIMGCIAVLVGVAGYMMLNLVTVKHQQDRVEAELRQANNSISKLSQGVDENANALRLANEKLKAAGKPTVPIPVSSAPNLIAGPPGATGPAGPGPTSAQVEAAVAKVLAENPGYTRSQVVTAVVSYLKSNPPASGKPGAPGVNGLDGKPGLNGSSPTAEQIQDAVESYCDQHDNCQGPKGDTGATGETGEPGKDGKNGRGIASITCSVLAPNTSFTITYTDGTTETIECNKENGGL